MREEVVGNSLENVCNRGTQNSNGVDDADVDASRDNQEGVKIVSNALGVGVEVGSSGQEERHLYLCIIMIMTPGPFLTKLSTSYVQRVPPGPCPLGAGLKTSCGSGRVQWLRQSSFGRRGNGDRRSESWRSRCCSERGRS